MNEIETIIMQALGEVSAVFMSQNCKGTEIEMPSEDLLRIGRNTAREIDIIFNQGQDR